MKKRSGNPEGRHFFFCMLGQPFFCMLGQPIFCVRAFPPRQSSVLRAMLVGETVMRRLR